MQDALTLATATLILAAHRLGKGALAQWTDTHGIIRAGRVHSINLPGRSVTLARADGTITITAATVTSFGAIDLSAIPAWLHPGTAVDAFHAGQWRTATVVTAAPSGRVKVRYTNRRGRQVTGWTDITGIIRPAAARLTA